MCQPKNSLAHLYSFFKFSIFLFKSLYWISYCKFHVSLRYESTRVVKIICRCFYMAIYNVCGILILTLNTKKLSLQICCKINRLQTFYYKKMWVLILNKKFTIWENLCHFAVFSFTNPEVSYRYILVKLYLSSFGYPVFKYFSLLPES